MTLKSQLLSSTAHSKTYPPSSADRYLSCPGSVDIAHLYPNDESEASIKGDHAHHVLEHSLIWGVKPFSDDPDVNEGVYVALDLVKKIRGEYPDAEVYIEQRLAIPITGEFGTVDIVIVTKKFIWVIDYKNGYVPVYIRMNGQLMSYLTGVIAKFGERKEYKISIVQPNYPHIEGPVRTADVTQDDLLWFEAELTKAVASRDFRAGKHCKKTYCPHRGACATFLAWAVNNASDAWFPHELNAIDDAMLAEVLDHAEVLQGHRDEARKEAMRRIINADRHIPGWKVVKSRTSREWLDDTVTIDAVWAKLKEMGAKEQDVWEYSFASGQKFASVKRVEDFVKKYCQANNLGRSAWKTMWANRFEEHVRVSAPGLSLERDIDGRPAHRRGGEFGALVQPDANVATVPNVLTVI